MKASVPGATPWARRSLARAFFLITGFHGLHVTVGVIYVSIVALRVLKGRYERTGNYHIVEIAGLYWHFVDLVWVFIFALFYLW